MAGAGDGDATKVRIQKVRVNSVKHAAGEQEEGRSEDGSGHPASQQDTDDAGSPYAGDHDEKQAAQSAFLSAKGLGSRLVH